MVARVGFPPVVSAGECSTLRLVDAGQEQTTLAFERSISFRTATRQVKTPTRTELSRQFFSGIGPPAGVVVQPHAADLVERSAQCAARRLAQFGPNEPAQRHRFSALAQFAHLFANPLVIIILVANAIAASLGQRIDALIIVTIVVLSVSINLWQSYQSAQAAERLRASVTPTATAFRDGRWQESPLRTESGICRFSNRC